MVAKIFVGGGTSLPFEKPSQTMSSQATARPTGSNSPSAGRVQRRTRPGAAAFATGSLCAAADSSTVMAIARTLLARDCKLANGREARPRAMHGSIRHARASTSFSLQRPRRGWPGHRRAEATPSFGRLCPAMALNRYPLSIRRQRHLVVDQAVECGLDVDLGVDHAGLLQGHACRKNGFTLRRADPVMGQLGALLELLVDHIVRQFGDGHEGLLQII